jgi:hypothetical protein
MTWWVSSRALVLRWLPTALGTALLVSELPLVAVSAARSADPARSLAALGIAMSVLVVVNAPALAMAGLVVVSDDVPTRRLVRYAVVLGFGAAIVLTGLALLPPVFAGLHTLLGLDAALAEELRWCLLSLAPNPLWVAVRRYLHGRLIAAHRTRPILLATLVRIAGSATVAWLAVAAVPQHGAAAAGVALTVGAMVEAALLAPVVRGLSRTPKVAAIRPPGLVRRHAQLASAWLLNNLPALITTIGIAHAVEPAASLVVWPVTYQLAVVFASPVADWDTVTARALRERAVHDVDHDAVRTATAWLTAVFGGLFAVVVVSGADTFYVREFAAVPPGPATLGLVWLWLLVPVPFLWVLRGSLRGAVMAGERHTGLVAAGAAHLLLISAAVVALGTTSLPGVAVGALSIVAGLVAETLVLRSAARRSRASVIATRP